MHITSYKLFTDRVNVYLSNNTILTIYFTADSGKAYYRYKIDTISKIKHPGIYIGVDAGGTQYFIHNHYQIGTASLVKRSEFDKNNPIYLYKEMCSNDWFTILRKAFDHLMRGEHYHFYNYNCQTLVNDVCDNKPRSQAAENWAAGIGIAGLALLLAACAGGGKK